MEQQGLVPTALALLLGSVLAACSLGGGSLGIALSAPQLAEKEQREETHALPIAAGESVLLETDYGRIQVSTSSVGRSELRATIVAQGRTAEEARTVLARYALEIARGQAGPEVRLRGEPLRIETATGRLELGAHVHYVAELPPGTGLRAESGSGDLEVRGALGACRLKTGHGQVLVEGVRGEVTAESGSGDLRARHLAGPGARLTSGYGAVTLSDSELDLVTCKSGSGDIQLASVSAASLTLETGYGAVHTRATRGELAIHSGSGDVHVAQAHGPIQAGSGYGRIELEGVLPRVRAESGSGDVRVIARAGSLGESSSLSSSYGSVRLSVPDGFACQLEAETGYGAIECAFPITIEAGRHGNERRLKGTIGAGGASLSLRSGSGDIALARL